MILVSLVALVLLARTGPANAPFGVRPVSRALPLVYACGLLLTKRTRDAPMRPRPTAAGFATLAWMP